MADYYISSSGDNSDGTTWAKAYRNWQGLHTRTNTTALTSADTVWVDSAHDDTVVAYSSANISIKGPADGNPARIISATYNTNTYALGTTDQVYFNVGAYDFELDGSFAVYGVTFNAKQTSTGRSLFLSCDWTEAGLFFDCTFKLPKEGRLRNASSQWGDFHFYNCTISCVNDDTNNTNPVCHFSSGGYEGIARFYSCTFTNLTFRTADPILNGYELYLSGCDLSNIPSGRALIGGFGGTSVINNCKLASTHTKYPSSSTHGCLTELTYHNSGSTSEGDRPWYIYSWNREGFTEAVSDVKRGTGVIIDGTAIAWKFRSTPASASNCSESNFAYTPWIYDYCATTGSKNFRIYFAQDGGSADFNNNEVWMELEYLNTSGQPLWAYATDWRGSNTAAGNITSTPAAQTDDTVSTWTGITATYKQYCDITRTVNQPGRFRARLCLGVYNKTIYVDPRVIVV